MTGSDVARTLAAIRARGPLVHNITNLVVTNFTANALLAVGASPAMVEGADEVEEFAAQADSLVINLGTMSSDRAAAMRLAVRAAVAVRTPWVLDPVAAGVMRYRTSLARDLLEMQPAAVRGNASEIMNLAGLVMAGRGVDSTAPADDARVAARDLAHRSATTVAVTGPIDFVTDGTRGWTISGGDVLMTRVTGMGCTATAIVGACLAVEPDPAIATVHGLALVAAAGEIAAERCGGPGSLHVEFLDALHGLDESSLVKRVRIVSLMERVA